MISSNRFYRATDRQMDILELVYKFRFINRHQIQKYLNHKDARRINAWLKDLVEHRYLGRIYSRKLLENTKPAIYFLSHEGIGWVRANHYEDEPEKVKRFYQDKHASQRFINHCVALVDLILQYKEIDDRTNYEHLPSTSSELWYEEELKNIRPDAYIERSRGKSDKYYSFFLELFDYYIPMYALRYKIDKYIELRGETDSWDIFSSDFKSIQVRMVFTNQQKLNKLGKYIQQQLDDMYVEGITFALTTYKKVAEKGIGAEIWQEVGTE